jgi:DNA-binding response OmpR family regulator
MMISGSIDPIEVRRELPHLADAMSKPFGNAELAARVDALLAAT